MAGFGRLLGFLVPLLILHSEMRLGGAHRCAMFEFYPDEQLFVAQDQC